MNSGKPVSFAHSLSKEARPVRAMIYDAYGKLVHEITFSRSEEVGHDITWDGKNKDGKFPERRSDI